MRNIRTYVLLLALPFSAAIAEWESTLFPQDFETENTLSNAISTAKKNGKHVILYATRSNCPPCKSLQALLRKDGIAKSYRESYTFTALWHSSMSQSELADHKQRYGVGGAPAWIVFTNTGQYICTARGGVFDNEIDGIKLHQSIQLLIASAKESTSYAPRYCGSGLTI